MNISDSFIPLDLALVCCFFRFLFKTEAWVIKILFFNISTYSFKFLYKHCLSASQKFWYVFFVFIHLKVFFFISHSKYSQLFYLNFTDSFFCLLICYWTSLVIFFSLQLLYISNSEFPLGPFFYNVSVCICILSLVIHHSHTLFLFFDHI